MRSLDEYRRKRNFERTPEPAGPAVDVEQLIEAANEGGEFVIQKHAASHLHYDLRLERDGVFKSWAVPKGPSLTPGEKRLAVRVEDHPLEYGGFEGVIPKKEYGGGTVMLWDRGRWAPVKRKSKRSSGEERIDFVLAGEKLRGAWTLVRTSGRSREGDNWMLIKRRDTAAGESEVTDLSVATGRTMQQIAADRSRTWTGAGEARSEGAAGQSSAALAPDAKQIEGAIKKALPSIFEPSLATLEQKAPAGENWLHEIKFDGYRIIARWDGKAVKLISRNGHDWTKRFPEIARVLTNLAAKKALLDGEVVAMAADGTTSFRDLQDALATGKTQNLIYQIFDLTHLDGHDLTKAPLTARKQTLAELLAASDLTGSAMVRYTDHIEGMGPQFAEQACRLGLEGIICKRADGSYRSGRSRDWLKVKCTAREELVVCGYTDPGGARTGFGSLLLGAWHKDQLVYAGRVGTGFNERVLAQLHKQLRKLELEQSALANPPDEKGLHWVEPELVAEVEFTEWTREGVLRHPSFRGLREDKDARQVQLPEAAIANDAAPSSSRRKSAPAAKRASTRATSRPGSRAGSKDSADVAGVKLTNASRILYPEQGITKLALAQYYEEIAPWILPQLAFRPLSLVRCPEGYTGECFFQKHPRATVDKAIARVMIEEKEGPSPYLYVQSLSDIIRLIQVGALELHVWGSRVDDVEKPDILVFDLDPSPDVPLAETMRVARDLRDRLTALGLKSFPRTTGGKGLHLVVPLTPERDWEQVKAFCHGVARAHAREDPRVTSNMAKTRRKGRIFLDYLRNGRGATAIGSYSARARNEAPVAVPVSWDEVTPALRPDRYNIENLRRRLAVLSEDPWQGFEAARRELTTEALRAVGVLKGDNG